MVICGKKLNFKNMWFGLFLTAFFCLLQLSLSGAYHYITTETTYGFLSYDSWSQPFKRDVFAINFMLIFIGCAISTASLFDEEPKPSSSE